MEAEARASPAPALPRGLRAALTGLAAALALGAFLLHLWRAETRYVNRDELEHLNAASAVARGETLYGTLFENHPPLTVALLQPVVRSSDDPETILRRGRLCSSAATLGTLLVVGWLGRALAGWPGAALAPLLLATHGFFAEKSPEVRPDVHATFLLVLALAVLGRGPGRHERLRLFLGGALLGLGGLFTPKIVYAAAGAVLGAALVAGARGSALRRGVRTALWVGAGAGLVAAVAALEMARRGMLAGFVRDCLLVSARMRIDDPAAFRRNLLARSLAENPTFWLLGLTGLALFLRARGPAARPAMAVLGLAFAAGLAGLAHIQAPLMQVHLTFLPQAAVAGAFAFVTVLAWATRRGGAAAWAALLLGLAACVLLAARRARQPHATKASQLAVIGKVRELTNETSRVLDCWTGLYLTRLPAYRYFYLNSDVLRLLDPAQLERELLACLDDRALEVVITGTFYGSLPASVRDRVDQEFVRVHRFPMLRYRPAPLPGGG